MANVKQDLSYEEALAEFIRRTELPENKMRQCLLKDKWNGEVVECDKCGLSNPTIGLYVCDYCDTLYCLSCTPTTHYFYVDNMTLTFCSKHCRKECVRIDYKDNTVCRECLQLTCDGQIQRIDPCIGQVCLQCLQTNY
jgi:hypothetical protein